ncbi:MAG: LysM peptidoglycan-binding domain-containing protein [Chlorobi bacterium]|nr:LysM peptidoglycan-binding domain-containing protein [Chlorobiota bacterium]
MQQMSDEQLSKRISEIDKLWADLNELRKNKIVALPEFYDKMVGLARNIKTLYDRAQNYRGDTYTVGTWQKDRDCLWNIAAKDDIYSDAFMWPKIWQENTDQIRNPDLIFPGQVLRIPPPGPKSDEELKAERLYYRQKREAARRAAAARRTRQVETDDAASGN